ncbi:MAG: hypothetical protein L0Y38_04375 [Methylococcaceae bacterium]|nr:hypothetical protein [Methylococcaceae bacterium]MCI0733045.1 hypothetical protein [Methylococcaceae bacterium]
MKKNKAGVGRTTSIVLAAGMVSTFLYAAVPAGRDELRIYPGNPQKPGESIVSISGRWVTDDGLQTGFTALAFVNGPDRPKPDSGQSVAKKVAHSMRRSMADLGLSLRGLSVDLAKNTDNPHYILKNKEGFSLSKLTVRDYINDRYTIEIGARSFGQHGAKVSLDLTESASIGKVIINYSAAEQKAFRAEGGGVEVTIGDGKTVTVETKNRSTEEIEQALASQVGGKFSSSPLFPDEREKQDEKNIKPFDGGEVQLVSLAANSFTVDVKDPSLGIINRYLFRDE